MGFRKGSYATVWEKKSISDTMTKLRISISRKDKRTGEYIQDFSGFVACVGTLAAGKALQLNERDRIQLGDVDVSSTYDKEKKVTYYDFKIFSFEPATEYTPSGSSEVSTPSPVVDEGEEDGLLPF